MSRVALSLFLSLVPLSLFAAGHDVSAVRSIPVESFDASLSIDASIAYNGNHFLTAWPMAWNIYTSRTDPTDGASSAAYPAVPLSLSSVEQLTPAGSGFVALCRKLEESPALCTFDSEGVLEHRVQLRTGRSYRPRMAFNGTNLLVVDLGISASMYDLTGRLVRRVTLPVEVSDSYAVTTAGTDFIVVTAGKTGINEFRLSADGTIKGTIPVQLPVVPELHDSNLYFYRIAVAAKEGRIGMVWDQLQPATTASAVIQPDGSVTRSKLPEGDLPPAGSAITLLPTDSGFFAAWNASSADRTGLFALRLDDSGAPRESRPVDLGNALFSSAASTGKTIALTRYLPSFRPTSTLLVDVDADGIRPRTPKPLPTLPIRQRFATVAGNGAGFTAAWVDWVSDSQNAVSGRVTAQGEALDGPGIILGQKATAPAIAHGSSGQLMVWRADGKLVAARITPFGTTLDAPPITIAPLSFPGSATYSVTWNGIRFYVVWGDGPKLFGAFVRPDGIAEPPRPLPVQFPPRTGGADPDVAWDGRQFIVVYGEDFLADACYENCFYYPEKERVLRVSADGIGLDLNPLVIPGRHHRAHIASSGTESLIALDGDTDTTAVVVLDDGAHFHVSPEIPLFHWFLNGDFASDVVWTGSEYVVAWRYSVLMERAGWIGASAISKSGVPSGSLVTPTAGPVEGASQSVPSVAANDAGETAIVISEMAPPNYVTRARLYRVSELVPKPAPPPPPRNVTTIQAGIATVITWQSDGQDGFLFEESADSGRNWSPAISTVGQSVTRVRESYYRFRVRAIGAGGLSEPVLATPGRVERRRAQRH